MNTMKTMMAVVAFGLVTGCATTYHPNSFTGGYSDTRLGPNVALVSFRGNGFSSGNGVMTMALHRAAELTLQSGYQYFVITGAHDDSSTVTINTPSYANTTFNGYGGPGYAFGQANTTFVPGASIPIHKPAVSFMIRMAKSQQELAGFNQIYDATFLQTSLATN